jgi:hypothetical protein
MKTTNKIALLLTALIGVSISSCKKDQFVELNTNPAIIDKITPEQQFMNSVINMHGDRFEYYYDNFRAIMPWMQMVTALNGNSVTFISDAASFRNVRYNNFYPKVGGNLTDMEELVKGLSADEQAKRVYQIEIAHIVKAYYAFYVSDVSGSLPYTDAFKVRYGGTETPKYDTQEALFDLLDTQLKQSVNILNATQSVAQTSLGANDLFYQGNVANWIKVANSTRLRIAMRLMILAAPGGLINSAADSWVFKANATYADGGDWSAAGLRAPKPVIDFMYNNSDPRIRFFYQENTFSQANFDAAKAQNKISASSVFDARRFYGVPTSPDVSAAPAFANFFNNIAISVVNNNGQAVNQTMDSLSLIQPRLFAAGENGGKGMNAFPLITYADVCFMRAELAARTVTTESAEDWYNKGVTASISFYDDLANKAFIVDRNGSLSYIALTPVETTNYMAKADIKYDPARGLDQIIGQAYLNFFKQPNEAWAIYKRTGMPNSSTVLKLEKIIASGTEQVIPRRASLAFPSVTNLNYQNIVAAYKIMQTDPDFGQGPSDINGRVWWDKK